MSSGRRYAPSFTRQRHFFGSLGPDTLFVIFLNTFRERLLATATVTRAAAASSSSSSSSSSGWWTVDLPPNFTHIQSVQQLVDELAEGAKSDQLVVVDFFAPWCGACRSLFPKLKKICAEHPDVRFLAINFDENPGLARGLGVKMLPFFHMYRGAEGRVCAFTASVSKVAKLCEAIESHKSPRCFLVQGPEYPLPEYPTILPGGSTLRPDPVSRETPIAMA